MICISLVWPQLRGGYFSTFPTFEIIDLTGIIWFSTLSETLISQLRTFTFIQPIIFNNGSIYYHCSNNCFQLLKNKNRSHHIESGKSQNWTCLVCSDRSTVPRAVMHGYYSSIPVGKWNLSFINIITSKSTVSVFNTTVRVQVEVQYRWNIYPKVHFAVVIYKYKSTVYPLDITSIIDQASLKEKTVKSIYFILNTANMTRYYIGDEKLDILCIFQWCT